MASMTLLEYAKSGQGTEFESAIIETFARSSMILEVLPFRNIQGNALRYNQEKALPGIAFRSVNGSYTPSHGIVNPVTEALKIAGGDLVVDTFLVNTEGGSRRALEEAMQLKALANAFQVSFFKGDDVADPNDLMGLQGRITGQQLISNAAAGAALSLANLDKAIDSVAEPTHIAMNKGMRRRITQAARNPSVGGYVIQQRDEFGRWITFYNDLPIIALEDLAGLDTVLPFTETSPDGASTTNNTSIYVMSVGPGKLEGIQNGPMQARDLGEMETKPALLTRVEWYPGLTIYHPRAVARLYGVQDAAVAA